MKKIYILFGLMLLILTGCENKEEILKNNYISIKNQTLKTSNFEKEELPVDIITTIERIDEENIIYKVIIKNPKENMHNVKAMVVHNYHTEDTFPTIGIFDNPKELVIDDNKTNELILKDIIKTTKNINKINLEIKVWIEYINELGEKKDICYKTT